MKTRSIEPLCLGRRPPVNGRPALAVVANAARVGLPLESERASEPQAARLEILRSVAGLLHPAALSVLLGGLTAGALLDGFLTELGGHTGPLLSLLGAASFAIAAATGVNAAGVLLIAEARNAPPPDVQAAAAHGLICLPKCLALVAVLLLAAALLMVLPAGALLACRLPHVGPLLLVVVFPLTVVVAGLGSAGLTLCFLLALAAIWDGEPLGRAIARAVAIVRGRPGEALLSMAAIGGLGCGVGVLVVGGLTVGLLPMWALAGSIFGAETVAHLPDALWNGPWAMAGAMASDAGRTATLAMVIGGTLLVALAASGVLLVLQFGLCIVYLRLQPTRQSDGLRVLAAGIGADPEELSATHADAPVRWPSLISAGPPEPVAGRAEVGSAVSATGAPRPRCPHCLSAVVDEDALFCTVCGYKLGA